MNFVVFYSIVLIFLLILYFYLNYINHLHEIIDVIIEIHKFAPVEYRGTPVCRWMDFFGQVSKPDKGKKKKAKYVPKKYKKKKGGGVYDMESDIKKKGRRR